MMISKRTMVTRFVEQNIEDISELFLLHQTVCSQSLVIEADNDVTLLTEFPERLQTSLTAQWRADVIKAVCKAPCWQSDNSAENAFEQYCSDLHTAVSKQRKKRSKQLLLINKVIHQPDTMGRFPTPLKRWLDKILKDV